MSNRPFDHIITIMLENQYRGYVMQNSYFKQLAKTGICIPNYFGVMHPSQTNYLPSIAGEHCGVWFDFPIPAADSSPSPPEIPLTQQTIVDLLEDKGISWKAYMQSYTKPLWNENIDPRDYPAPFPIPEEYWPDSLNEMTTQPPYPYAFWHNPFSMFQSIVRSEERWNKIDDEAGFWQDVLNGSLPRYSWFSPNLWHDGHSTYGTTDDPDDRAPALVDQAAEWLETFFAKLRFPGPDTFLPPRTLVVVTYDEADFEGVIPCSNQVEGSYDGPNQIYTVLLGDMINPTCERHKDEGYNHYSLLRTIEKNFELDDLGKNDATSNWFQFLWGRKLQWSIPEKTNIAAIDGILSCAALEDSLYVVTGDGNGGLNLIISDDSKFSEPQAIPLKASAASLEAHGNVLVLTFYNEGVLSSLEFNPSDSSWSSPVTVTNNISEKFAVTAFRDYDSNNAERLLVACQPTSGNAKSFIYSDGEWGAEAEIPQAIEGDMTIGTLGSLILLAYKEPDSDQMWIRSYNTASYSVLHGVKNDGDTCQHAWSQSQFPVAHFCYHHGRTTQEPDPLTRAYSGRTPFAMATLDGVLHFVHQDSENSNGMDVTFSNAGVMTAKNPIVFSGPGISQPDGTCPGWGTLAESGWSKQRAMPEIMFQEDSQIAACRKGSTLVLVYPSEDDNLIKISVAKYLTNANT